MTDIHCNESERTIEGIVLPWDEPGPHVPTVHMNVRFFMAPARHDGEQVFYSF